MRYEWGYLVAFLLGVLWELYAIFDGNADTWPLTVWIITYVPQWVFWPILVAVFVWLVYHFKKYYLSIASSIKK